MGTRERAMKLLGGGVDQEIVSTALGVTPGYISQLLAEPAFAQEVSQLRLLNLESATERDGKYDTLEDKMLSKLSEVADYMTKPREVLGAIAVLNKAVRRGVRQEQQPTVKQDVVIINLPTVIQQKFITNQSNQVIAVGTGEESDLTLKDLTTITAKALLERTRMIPVLQPVEVIEYGTSSRERIPERARG
jgi:hypothetical protein